MFNNTITYTFDEFFDVQRRKEVEKLHRKKDIEKVKKVLGVTATVLTFSILTVYGIKGSVVVVPVNAAAKTLVACTSTTMVEKGKMDIFNSIVVDALNKLYVTTCMGGLAVESIQCNNNTEKKFSSCLSKYTIAYAGGLFVLYTLSEIKNLA